MALVVLKHVVKHPSEIHCILAVQREEIPEIAHILFCIWLNLIGWDLSIGVWDIRKFFGYHFLKFIEGLGSNDGHLHEVCRVFLFVEG